MKEKKKREKRFVTQTRKQKVIHNRNPFIIRMLIICAPLIKIRQDTENVQRGNCFSNVMDCSNGNGAKVLCRLSYPVRAQPATKSSEHVTFSFSVRYKYYKICEMKQAGVE